MILVTGGAGFIGANFVLDWLAATGEPVVNLDKLTYAGNLETSASLRGDPRHVFVRGDIGDRALVGELLREHRPRADRPLRRRDARRPLDRRPGARSSRPTSSAPSSCSRRRAPTGGAARRRARGVPLPARLDRRGLRLARPGRSAVHRDDAVRAEQPVLGVEGRVRPPGARLSPHLRAADAHHQLLEQLRAVSVSGEADPADDPQRARGKPLPVYGDGRTFATGCTSTITARRSARCSRAARPARRTTSAATPRDEPRHRRARSADPGASSRPGRDSRALITFVKDRPGHDRRYAIDAVKIGASSAGSRRKLRQRLEARRAGISTTASGSTR